MSNSSARGGNGVVAAKSVPDTDIVRHRTSPQPLVCTALIVEPRSLIRELLTRALTQRAGFNIVAVRSIDEYLGRGCGDPSIVLISLAGTSNAEDARMTLRHAAQTLPQIPTVVLSDSENLHSVLSLLQSGTRGYISTGMSLDVAIEALWLVQAGGQFLPAECIIKPSNTPANTNQATNIFTARQAAVVKAVCQGKANKIIAYELKMKESTVKVHVRNIMKKLKAKNRTEVAYITRQLAAVPGE